MDIESNLWTTCVVLMETTASRPKEEKKNVIADRTDSEEILDVLKIGNKKRARVNCMSLQHKNQN